MKVLVFAAIVLQAGLPSRPEATNEPAIVLSAERAWAGADILWPLANSAEQNVALYAIRALGRLEDPKLVPQLIQLTDTKSEAIRLAAASALAQTLWHLDPKSDPDTIAKAAAAIRRVYGGVPIQISGQALGALGDLAYANPSDVAAAEDILADVMERTGAGHDNAAAYSSAVHGFEALTRRNARLPGISYKPASLEKLSSSARNEHQNDIDPTVRQNALRALLNARAVDSTVLSAVVKDDDEQVRRIAVQILGGNVFATDPDSRFQDVHRAMGDPSALVRLEALRSYARRVAATNGCGPLLDSLQDDSLHMVLAALDALATACPGDEDVTTRLMEEARPAPTVGPWQREAHAYLALTRRDPDRAVVVAQSYVSHPSWMVRLYGARAAAAAGDVPRLERLSLDENDNVREATLAALQKLKKTGADDVIVADLLRGDYQLLRTTALLLKESPVNATFAKPVLAALLRVTREGKETSRDARLALLDALHRHAGPDQADELMPLTRDLDPKVATRASELLSKWTGKAIDAQPVPVMHTAVRDYANLKECVAVTMDGGRRFRLRMEPDSAPISAGRFLKIALEDRYYDGLTFHRVEPNFVIQGGSPGANEYSSGQKYFMRDEVAAPNKRGAVGLSTRGRNTGDGQFYIMLVDDPRLDHEYTIFAHVFDEDLDVVDRIEEGDRISTIRSTSCR
jgi:cyclophilin family peptidyl-prolyl cis-trans isomerase/HEAT repeat protein